MNTNPTVQLDLPIETINVVEGHNPRKSFDGKALNELRDSIERFGLIQPIVVRAAGDGTYELIAGERRLRAMKELNWPEIPCILRDEGDEARILALIENVVREDLHPLDEAEAVARLLKSGVDDDEAAARLGKNVTWVRRRKAVSRLPKKMKSAYGEGAIGLLTAEFLASVRHRKQRGALFNDATRRKAGLNHLKDRYARMNRVLGSAAFDLTQCETCRFSSLFQADLFGARPTDPKEAICTCPKDFDQRQREHFEAQKQKYEGKRGRIEECAWWNDWNGRDFVKREMDFEGRTLKTTPKPGKGPFAKCTDLKGDGTNELCPHYAAVLERGTGRVFKARTCLNRSCYEVLLDDQFALQDKGYREHREQIRETQPPAAAATGKKGYPRSYVERAREYEHGWAWTRLLERTDERARVVLAILAETKTWNDLNPPSLQPYVAEVRRQCDSDAAADFDWEALANRLLGLELGELTAILAQQHFDGLFENVPEWNGFVAAASDDLRKCNLDVCREFTPEEEYLGTFKVAEIKAMGLFWRVTKQSMNGLKKPHLVDVVAGEARRRLELEDKPGEAPPIVQELLRGDS